MRSLVYWWLLGLMSRDWWSQFLDKYGTPFLVGKYSPNDEDSRTVLERAFQYATRVGGLVVSSETSVELQKAASMDSGDAFDKFLTICNREKSKLILGQTLSSEAQATGLGSGVADNQEAMRQDKRISDARRLAATLRGGLFKQYLRINGLSGAAPSMVFGSVSSSEIAALGSTLVNLKTAGLRVKDDSISIISERVGFELERDPTPATAASPFGGLGLRALSARPESSEAEIFLQNSFAALAPILGKDYAEFLSAIEGSNTPSEALERIEEFCARYDYATSSGIMETALHAFANTGSRR